MPKKLWDKGGNPMRARDIVPWNARHFYRKVDEIGQADFDGSFRPPG